MDGKKKAWKLEAVKGEASQVGQRKGPLDGVHSLLCTAKRMSVLAVFSHTVYRGLNKPSGMMACSQVSQGLDSVLHRKKVECPGIFTGENILHIVVVNQQTDMVQVRAVFVPGLPHVMCVELRQAQFAYQDYHMLLVLSRTHISPTFVLPSIVCTVRWCWSQCGCRRASGTTRFRARCCAVARPAAPKTPSLWRREPCV